MMTSQVLTEDSLEDSLTHHMTHNMTDHHLRRPLPLWSQRFRRTSGQQLGRCILHYSPCRAIDTFVDWKIKDAFNSLVDTTLRAVQANQQAADRQLVSNNRAYLYYNCAARLRY